MYGRGKLENWIKGHIFGGHGRLNWVGKPHFFLYILVPFRLFFNIFEDEENCCISPVMFQRP